MPESFVHLLAAFVIAAVLLAPPLGFLALIATRALAARPHLGRGLKVAAALGALVLAVNAAVLALAPPQPTVAGLQLVHFMAFSLSWACLCGTIGIAVFVRRPRRREWSV